MDRLLTDREASEEFALAGHARARQRYDTPRVLPQVLGVYEDGSDYFHQVRAAGGERTAQQWRRALDIAKHWRGKNNAADTSTP